MKYLLAKAETETEVVMHEKWFDTQAAAFAYAKGKVATIIEMDELNNYVRYTVYDLNGGETLILANEM
ncbi:MAG: hypothetical protein ACK5MW_04900 [Enterococcus sp.]